MKQKPVFYYY